MRLMQQYLKNVVVLRNVACIWGGWEVDKGFSQGGGGDVRFYVKGRGQGSGHSGAVWGGAQDISNQRG